MANIAKIDTAAVAAISKVAAVNKTSITKVNGATLASLSPIFSSSPVAVTIFEGQTGLNKYYHDTVFTSTSADFSLSFTIPAISTHPVGNIGIGVYNESTQVFTQAVERADYIEYTGPLARAMINYAYTGYAQNTKNYLYATKVGATLTFHFVSNGYIGLVSDSVTLSAGVNYRLGIYTYKSGGTWSGNITYGTTPPARAATGGTMSWPSGLDGKTLYTFTASSTFTVIGPGTFEVFTLGGGAGAGQTGYAGNNSPKGTVGGGGGGGAGLRTGSHVLEIGTYTVTIGGGGAGGSWNGGSGGTSDFGGLQPSNGGGGGGGNQLAGIANGNAAGGGGGAPNTSGGAGGTYGNAGANSGTSGTRTSSTRTPGGAGGSSKVTSSAFSGTTVSSYGIGGSASSGATGGANTGSGGSASGYTGTVSVWGKAGGSGLVMVK